MNQDWLKTCGAKLDSIDVASLNKEDREKYYESLKVYRDWLATLAYAKQEGKQEGVIAVARKMKAKGLPTDLIAETTGLSIEEIEKL